MFKVRHFIMNNVDGFTMTLLIVMLLAFALPVAGPAYKAAAMASKLVVALLFFLHGLHVSPQNLWAGLSNWKLHLTISSCTFILFPLIGFSLKPFFKPFLGDNIYSALLFVCLLPSTVQSSIAFTSIAKGNVAAAVCAASASSILGIFITPALVGIFLGASAGGFSLEAVWNLCLQLLFPFALGQGSRPYLNKIIEKNKKVVGYVDRASVLFIVYVSFSYAVSNGLWQQLTFYIFIALCLACAVLLAIILLTTNRLGKLLGFKHEDSIVILFCGSKKSLVTGVPMANVIFNPAVAGLMILPLMIFHQMQLMACSFIAGRMAKSYGADQKAQ